LTFRTGSFEATGEFVRDRRLGAILPKAAHPLKREIANEMLGVR